MGRYVAARKTMGRKENKRKLVRLGYETGKNLVNTFVNIIVLIFIAWGKLSK
jgi:hypothetical protein